MDAKELKELSSADYWDRRYTKQSEKVSSEDATEGTVSTHEWFRSFKQLESLFDQQLGSLPKDGAILHLGCGDSSLPADLHALGFRNQVCVDFSQVVIKQMHQRYESLDTISWVVMDVRHLEFPADSIDMAIDKGTLDAFLHGSLWDPPDEVRENVGKYVDSVGRVLRPGASWIYITYRQPHFIKPLLCRPIWDLEVQNLDQDAGSFGYFAFIMRKHFDVDGQA